MKMFLRSAIAASAMAFVAVPAFAQDLVFMLSNNTGVDMIEFYASPTNVSSWEEDILGADILMNGESAEITIADGRTQCDYDLLMTFADGDAVEDTVNLCETGSYTIE